MGILKKLYLILAMVTIMAAIANSAVYAAPFTSLSVVDENGAAVPAYRWLLQEDTTHLVVPGTFNAFSSVGVSIHKSYAPPVAKGTQANLAHLYASVNTTKRYFVSILPDPGAVVRYSIGGASIAKGQASATVIVDKNPIPTAQILIYAFEDNRPINATPDPPAELGLAGFEVLVFDQLGLMTQDIFGNNLGTTYQKNPDGTFVLDADGAPVVDTIGSGIVTGANGEVLVKNLAPGKYGVRVVPPPGEDWVQTSTIEGTPGVDVWIRADEPPALQEFGIFFYHVFAGFVRPMTTVTIVPAPDPLLPLGSVSGQVVKAHSSRFSQLLIQPGEPQSGAWVGINNLNGNDELIYAAPCDADGNFNISGLPPGIYQIVIWDENLDVIIAFYTFIIPADGSSVLMGQLIANQWFGNIEGTVFNDIDASGAMDAGEPGIPNMLVNLRFRDGSLYQSSPTDMMGGYSFGEVFPFFKWLVMEADSTRLKATGATFNVDDGAHVGDVGISFNPQNQFPTPYISDLATPQIGAGPRTELATSPIMREGFILYADQNLFADFGKQAYTGTENGGITGRINYATTRAENDPQFAAADAWEPGIPGVTVELYQVTGTGVDGLPIINPVAIASTVSEGWDTNMPTGCANDDPRFVDCAETIETWNQARPAPYDGFYSIQTLLDGITPIPAGDYVVKVVPPTGFVVVKNGDQNVYTGDTFKPSLLSKGLTAAPPTFPPPCVGVAYTIPAVLSIDGQPNPDTANIGQTAFLCDSKEIHVRDGQNTAADFHLFTEVPLAARCEGLITNDILTQPNPVNPGFAEKLGPVWLPVSFQDYLGNEVARTHTDETGRYSALVPSSYTVSAPIPTGVSPNMLQIVLNDKGADPANPDPFYDPTYSTTSYTFDFWPGKISYSDTPVLPISASQTVRNLDCELAADSPVISRVDGPAGGPVVKTTPSIITISAVGDVLVPNPAFDPTLFPPDGTPATITRHYGFGATTGSVLVNSVALPVVSWSDLTITATVPNGTKNGHLSVVRADGVSAKVGVFLRIKPTAPIKRVAPGASIQAAIDSAVAGTIILVPPAPTAAGYTENLIISKKIKLQGYGAGSTLINAGTFTLADQNAWTRKVNNRIKAGTIKLVPGQRFDLGLDKGAGITLFGKPGTTNTANQYMIDGFTISGAQRGGGINVNGYVNNLQISNNVIKGNEGSFGGGIRIGTPSLVNAAKTGFVSNANRNINIHNNMIIANGGIDGGGGIALFNGSDNYVVESNSICGNFALVYGGGLAHFGLSKNGLIYNNEIKFNQAFDEGGGLMIAGELVPAGAPVGTMTPGAGNVTVDRNLILSNIAGDDGGGIRTLLYNGQDVAANPTNTPQHRVNGILTGPPQWHHLNLYNNMIINNVSADAGGGVSLDNNASINMVHNTIAHNDSTAIAVDAFGANSQTSTAQISGVQSNLHNTLLTAAFDATVSQTYTDPVMWNNIIYNNRSWYWDFTADPVDRPEGLMIRRGFIPGQPDTAADPTLQYWDLGILGATAGEVLHPMYCDLTPTTENTLYDASNINGNPLFVATYLNTIFGANAGGPAGNLLTQTLIAQDPSLYDYHINAGSPAIDAGATVLPIDSGWPTLLNEDFDGEQRPNPGTNLPDIGADETY